jgi:hypothetical protein
MTIIPKGVAIVLAVACLLATAGVSFGPEYMRDGFNNAPKAFDAYKPAPPAKLTETQLEECVDKQVASGRFERGPTGIAIDAILFCGASK